MVNKDVEDLRQDFLTTSLAGKAPELLWTVADHVGPFTAADTILPLDGLIDPATYLPNALAAVQADGQTWGVPISYGNHLMLYWNKDLVAECPGGQRRADRRRQGLTDAAAGNYGLVFNQTESFWLVPFLGGFGGSVFAEDGKTPTLNTPAMVNALTFLQRPEVHRQASCPPRPTTTSPTACSRAATAGDRSSTAPGPLGRPYADVVSTATGRSAPVPMLGDKLTLRADGPGKPYTAGAFFMFSKALADDAAKQAAVVDFVKFATGKDPAARHGRRRCKRLPGNQRGLRRPGRDRRPVSWPRPRRPSRMASRSPTKLEMRCVFDSMTAGVHDLFTTRQTPIRPRSPRTMQSAADAGVAPGWRVRSR